MGKISQEMIDKAERIGALVEKDYDLEDGADHAYHLLESGRLKLSDSDERCASIVAHNIHPDFQ